MKEFHLVHQKGPGMADHSAAQTVDLRAALKGSCSGHHLAHQTAGKSAHLTGRSRGKQTAPKRGNQMGHRLVEQMARLMVHHSAGCWVELMADRMEQPWAYHWACQTDAATAGKKADKTAESTAATSAVSMARNWVHKKAGQTDCLKAVHWVDQTVVHSAA